MLGAESPTRMTVNQLEQYVFAQYQIDALLTQMMVQLLDSVMNRSVSTEDLKACQMSILNGDNDTLSIRAMAGQVQLLKGALVKYAGNNGAGAIELFPNVDPLLLPEKLPVLRNGKQDTRTPEEVPEAEWAAMLKKIMPLTELNICQGFSVAVLQPKKFLTSLKDSEPFIKITGELLLDAELTNTQRFPSRSVFQEQPGGPEIVFVEDIIHDQERNKGLQQWIRAAFWSRRLWGVIDRTQLEVTCRMLTQSCAAHQAQGDSDAETFLNSSGEVNVTANQIRRARNAIERTVAFARSKQFRPSSWPAITIAAVSQGRQGTSALNDDMIALQMFGADLVASEAADSVPHVFFPTFHEIIVQEGQHQLDPYAPAKIYACRKDGGHMKIGGENMTCPICLKAKGEAIKAAKFTE